MFLILQCNPPETKLLYLSSGDPPNSKCSKCQRNQNFPAVPVQATHLTDCCLKIKARKFKFQDIFCILVPALRFGCRKKVRENRCPSTAQNVGSQFWNLINEVFLHELEFVWTNSQSDNILKREENNNKIINQINNVCQKMIFNFSILILLESVRLEF